MGIRQMVGDTLGSSFFLLFSILLCLLLSKRLLTGFSRYFEVLLLHCVFESSGACFGEQTAVTALVEFGF